MYKSIDRSGSAAILVALVVILSTWVSAQTEGPNSDDTAKPTQNDEIAATTVKKDVKNTSVGKYFSPRERNAVKSADSDSSTAGVVKQTSTSGDKWEFAFSPYLYLSGMSGTLGAKGRTTDIDLSIGDVLSHFKIGFMGTFEARKGKVVILNDMIWTKLGEEKDTPGGLYSTVKVGSNMFIWNPYVGYKVYESKGGSFDILGGFRLTSSQNTLTLTTGKLTGFDVAQRKTWAAPVFGGHGVVNLSPKAFLSTIFDIGGGFGTHVTGQFYGGFGYNIKPKISMLFGYRYLKNDYDDNNGYVSNTNMNGLVLGTKFKF